MLWRLCENLLVPKRSKSDATAAPIAIAVGAGCRGGRWFPGLLPEITTPSCVSRALTATACPSQANAGRERVEMFKKVFIFTTHHSRLTTSSLPAHYSP